MARYSTCLFAVLVVVLISHQAQGYTLERSPPCNCVTEHEWLFDFGIGQTWITMKVNIHPTGAWSSYAFWLAPLGADSKFTAYVEPTHKSLWVRTEESQSKGHTVVTVNFGKPERDGYAFSVKWLRTGIPRVAGDFLEADWSWTLEDRVVHVVHLWLPVGFSADTVNFQDYSTTIEDGRDYVTFSGKSEPGSKFYWNVKARSAMLITLDIVNLTLMGDYGIGAVSMVVDGTKCSAEQFPKTIHWLRESSHSLTIQDIVPVDTGIRYKFVGWSDLSAETSRVIRATYPMTLTARYKIQFQLATNSLYGNAIGSGWYDAGEVVTIDVAQSDMFLFVFRGWVGSISSSNSREHVFMDGPKTITAVWVIDFLRLLLVLGPVVGSASVFLVYRRRAKTRRVHDQAAEPESTFAEDQSPSTTQKPRNARLLEKEGSNYSAYLARLEELKAHGQVSEETYRKLKEQYEEKLK